MKNQVQDLIAQAKEFMRKHAFLIVSLKVVKVLVVIFLLSCSSNQESSKGVDTVKYDDTSLPGDTAIYKYDEKEEGEDGEEEGNDNPIAPQES
jgi:hypothetical protein